MSDKICFFFPSSLFKNNYATKAMKGFLNANKNPSADRQIFYQSFEHAIDITPDN